MGVTRGITTLELVWNLQISENALGNKVILIDIIETKSLKKNLGSTNSETWNNQSQLRSMSLLQFMVLK